MKRHALFVGVNTYDDPSIRPLRFSISDASVLADRFSGLGFECKHLPDPTAAQLKSAVEKSVEGLGPGDVFLFFFSGHGFTAQDGSHLLFCRDDREKLLRVNGAGTKVEVLEMLAEGPFHRAFLLDSCRSDALTGIEHKGACATKDIGLVAIPKSKGSTFILRSCDKFLPSLEVESLGHGLFTRGLLDAIVARDPGLARCGTDFADSIRTHMAKRAAEVRAGFEQSPCTQLEGPAFSLFRADFVAPTPHLVVCPICGRKNEPKDTFKCRKCGRDNLCLRHQDDKTFLCGECCGKMPPHLGVSVRSQTMAGNVGADFPNAPTRNEKLLNWVDRFVQLCSPDKVVWCNGSKKEWKDICEMMVKKGQFTKLNPKLRPDCYLARSDVSDVARVDGKTFISTAHEIDAGPTHRWIAPDQLKKILFDPKKGLFAGCMEGRTMYVIPFAMGPLGNPLTKYGVEITDSPYVVVNMEIMTRVGTEVLAEIEKGMEFVPCLHSVGAPLKKGQKDVAWPCAPLEKKYICHFPEDPDCKIVSFGSGYGGNAMLGKTCFALRIASVLARDEGWMAEHMCLFSLTSPVGRKYHITAAFPPYCGKTNLAMMEAVLPGWKLETIGDDIAWLKPGTDGRLYAINPENGFFAVAPGTSIYSNPNGLLTCRKGTIFTNVVLTQDGDIWWEYMGVKAPEVGMDWRGNPCYRCKDDPWLMGPQPGMTRAEIKKAGYVAAHKNSRFTAPAMNCPVLDQDGFEGWFEGMSVGVPIDAILFGGRRPSTIPLVNEAKDWTHGVVMGSAVGCEITAAVISDKIGQVRRDPMAMLPFFGYNVCDYFQHWLEMERLSPDATKLPKIFFVNWFRMTDRGEFMWRGFGDNVRVLKWICDRVDGNVKARDTPIGLLPYVKDIPLDGNSGTVPTNTKFLKKMLEVYAAGWRDEIKTLGESYDEYDHNISKDSLGKNRRVPTALRHKLAEIMESL